MILIVKRLRDAKALFRASMGSESYDHECSKPEKGGSGFETQLSCTLVMRPWANQTLMKIRTERTLTSSIPPSFSSHRTDGETEVQGKVIASPESKQIH